MSCIWAKHCYMKLYLPCSSQVDCGDRSGSSSEQEMKEKHHGGKNFWCCAQCNGTGRNRCSRDCQEIHQTVIAAKHAPARTFHTFGHQNHKAIFPYSGQPPPGWQLGSQDTWNMLQCRYFQLMIEAMQATVLASLNSRYKLNVKPRELKHENLMRDEIPSTTMRPLWQGMGDVWRSLACWRQIGEDPSYGGNGWKDRNSVARAPQPGTAWHSLTLHAPVASAQTLHDSFGQSTCRAVGQTERSRPDPLDWKSGLASAAASAAGDFLGQFWDNDKWLGKARHIWASS